MAIYWGWGFSIGGSAQNYRDSGWIMNADWNMAYTGAPLPRLPPPNLGGYTYGMLITSYAVVVTPVFPNGALADGIAQLQRYHDVRDYIDSGNRYLSLCKADGTVLLELRPTTSGAGVFLSTLSVYSGEPLAYRGVTTGLIRQGTWQTIAVRFEPGGAGVGNISVTIDDVTDNIVVNADVGTLSNWSRVGVTNGYAFYGCIITGYSVWDSAADTGLTIPEWGPVLRPDADVVDGAWLNQAGSGVNMYQSIDEVPISTADYITTTTDPDTASFGVSTATISAAWAPDVIDGIVVIGSMRGGSGLSTGEVMIDDGAAGLLYGATLALDAETSCCNDVFTTQGDGVTAWDKAAVDSHSFGIRAS